MYTILETYIRVHRSTVNELTDLLEKNDICYHKSEEEQQISISFPELETYDVLKGVYLNEDEYNQLLKTEVDTLIFYYD